MSRAALLGFRLALVTALGIGLGVAATPAAAVVSTVRLSGAVTDQGGVGREGVVVTVTAPGSSTVLSGPATTNTVGAYELDVEPGVYDIHFAPPASSGLDLSTVTNFPV